MKVVKACDGDAYRGMLTAVGYLRLRTLLWRLTAVGYLRLRKLLCWESGVGDSRLRQKLACDGDGCKKWG